MERNIQRTGLINWLVLLGMGALLAFEAVVARSATGEISVAFAATGFLVALASWFQMWLTSREEAERVEMDELARSRRQGSIFDATAEETFPARRARVQFEKWVVPAFTLVLFIVQAGAVVWFARSFAARPAPDGEAAVLAMALFAAMGLFLFILGRYSTRLSQLENARILRPGASSVMLLGLLAFLAAITEAAEFFKLPRIDIYVGWALVGILGVVALETLLALVFEAYRPRVKGREVRLIYESRLIGLLGQPAGIFGTAAHAFDYQFGFKVSETWFYKFIQERILQYALYWMLILMASTCVVSIEPGEQGLVERFGKPGAEPLNSGLHLKLPWPIDRVYRFGSGHIHSFDVGFIPEKDSEKERVLIWTRSHYREEVNFVVASREQTATNSVESSQTVPVNLLTASIPVQYLINDVRAWAYNHGDPDQLLQDMAYREVVRYFASVDVETIMSVGRRQASQDLAKRIQDAADAAKLGVQIIFVGLQDIHPPMGTKEIQVAGAYEKVIGAEQEREAKILAAQGSAFEMLPSAQASSTRLQNDAKSYAVLKTQDAEGRAERFGNQLAAYKAAPGVFKARNYYEALANSLSPARKYVVLATNTHDVVIYDLEEKIRPDLSGAVRIQNPDTGK